MVSYSLFCVSLKIKYFSFFFSDQLGERINQIVMSLCEVLDSTVSDMLLNSEESEPIIKIVSRIGVVTGHVLRQFHDFFDVSAISRITGKIINYFKFSF